MDLPNAHKLLKFYDKVQFKTAGAGVLVQPSGRTVKILERMEPGFFNQLRAIRSGCSNGKPGWP